MGTKISGMTPKEGALAGTEELEVNDGGTTRKVTAQQIADLGGGGGEQVFVLQLSGEEDGLFDGNDFTNWSPATVVQTSEDVHFDNTSKSLIFDRGGRYRISIRGTASGSGGWPVNDIVLYGSKIGGVVFGRHARADDSTFGGGFLDSNVIWTDECDVSVALDDDILVALYARSYDSATDGCAFSARLYVQYIGSAEA